MPSWGDFWQGLETPEREGQGAVGPGTSPRGWPLAVAVPGTSCGQRPACPVLLAGSCWCLPAGKGFSDSSNTYQLGSSSGAGCVRLSVLLLCLGRRLLLPAEINVCGLPFITPLGAALEVFSRWCWFSSCSVGALEQLGPRLAGWLGWDDGLEVGFHQQGHPSRDLQGGRSSSWGLWGSRVDVSAGNAEQPQVWGSELR